MSEIRLAQTEAELLRCFPVMVELRPHLAESEFVARVRLQMGEDGYQLAYLIVEGVVLALAGFRFGRFLAWGKILYVDDLVTASAARSQGLGGLLLDWLVQHARDQNCDELHLDSGVQRFDAHRFYLQKRMAITSHHFALKLRT